MKTEIKTRVGRFFNKKDKSLLFGIEIKIGTSEWMGVKDDKKPLLFESRSEANKQRRELQTEMEEHYAKTETA